MEKKVKICGVTGHRIIPPDKIEFVRSEMTKKILAACATGYNWFISGFADGADLLFAEIVRDIQIENNNIYLEAALPYPKQKQSKRMKELLDDCTAVNYFSEKYHPRCYALRNEYIADQSSLIIAIYDGRCTGGTFMTMQFARNRGKELQIIAM